MFNDLWDAGRDRLHPDKQHRPVAAGAVSQAAAGLLSAGLAAVGGGLAFAGTPPGAGAVLLGYVGLQLVDLRLADIGGGEDLAAPGIHLVT